MTHYGYARVSTEGQTLDAQTEALKALGCDEVFQERISGVKADRPQLSRLLAKIGKGDQLTVTRLDRLARSTKELLSILDTLAARGALFRSIADPWADTTTPHGRLMLTVLGGLAEFERELIRSRTSEGRARAKARGQHMGRPLALTAHQREEAAKALAAGAITQADLARQFNVSPSTISRLADKATPPPIARTIDAQTARATSAFMRRIKDRYSVREAFLYGSRARQTHTPDSDADVAVILEGSRANRFAVIKDMAGMAFDVLVETGVNVQVLPLWEDEVKRPEAYSNPVLLENIRREGLRL